MTKTEKPTTKKITLRDKKRAQPGAKIYFSEEEKETMLDFLLPMSGSWPKSSS